MEFIEKSYHNLVIHLIKNGIGLKESDFKLLDSINQEASEIVNVTFLNLFVDREKTPKNKFIRDKLSYSKAKNHFDILFSLHIEDINRYASASKILVDFEKFFDEGRVKLLNSISDFETYHLFDFLLKGYGSKTPPLFVKISLSEFTLQPLPKVKEVKKIVFANKSDKKILKHKNKIYKK